MLRKKIILAALLLNVVTFTLARIWWGIRGELAANLEKHIGDPEDDTMTYLIAGNLNQASTAFRFMEPKFGANYTFVQFTTKGWSVKATAKKIASDIRKHDYRARVFTISLGDQVARYLERDLGRPVAVYAINPCLDRDVVRPPLNTVLKFATPVAEVVCHGFGWLSYLPIIPSFGNKYSMMLLIDQYWAIAHEWPPLRTTQTLGVICSTNDTLLVNSVIESNYLDAEITYVEAGHSDIVNAAEAYYDAICTLLD